MLTCNRLYFSTKNLKSTGNLNKFLEYQEDNSQPLKTLRKQFTANIESYIEEIE
jgi:hypothetical protein